MVVIKNFLFYYIIKIGPIVAYIKSIALVRRCKFITRNATDSISTY